MIRDFTFIDDIIESLIRVINKPATADINFKRKSPNPARSWVPFRIFNIGNSNPIPLMEYISAIEDTLGVLAQKKLLPMQPGDVAATAADTSALEEWTGFKPNTPVKEGVEKFVRWYRDFYGV